MRRPGISALLILLLPLRLVAQGSGAAPEAGDTTQYVRISPAIGLHYGVPLRISLAAGGLFDFRGSHNDGVIAMGEVGQGGTEISIGYFRMLRFGQGFDVRAAGIRTGDDTWKASPGTTYLGAEAHLMFLVGVGGRIGWFRRATAYSGMNRYDNLGTIGVSIGL
jgi:hypothetical protein